MEKILKRHKIGGIKPKKVPPAPIKTDAAQPQPPASPPLPAASEPSAQFSLKIYGLGELELTRQLKHVQYVYDTVQNIDVYLLSCSDVSIRSTHQLDQNSSFHEAQVNVFIDIHISNADSNIRHIYDFLDKGRQAILTCDYSSPHYFERLVRTLTEFSVELDEQINAGGYLRHNKCINKVKLAKVIETFSRINKTPKTGFAFEISSNLGVYGVKTIDECKAMDLLGGKYIDDKCFIGSFIVNKITFEDIENKLEFILDGTPVKVFITHKQWVAEFNNHKVKLAKGDRIKAKTLVERSPINNKIMAYHFVEIIGINI